MKTAIALVAFTTATVGFLAGCWVIATASFGVYVGYQGARVLEPGSVTCPTFAEVPLETTTQKLMLPATLVMTEIFEDEGLCK